MLQEVIEALAPKKGQTIIDGTFGAGGYTRAILEAADCSVIAIDRDPTAIEGGAELAKSFPDRLKLILGRYSEMADIAEDLGIAAVDGVALDLGISSMQLDEAERGFSFMQDGPLDMRMGAEGPTASDIVNEMPEADLSRIIAVLGEERRARAIARAICAARTDEPILTTGALAAIVAKVLGRKRDETKHPATRTFQALRLYLNAELDELAYGLSAAERLLAPEGRLVVVTFHSLEDRIAKRFLASRSLPPSKGSRHLPDPGEETSAPSFQLLNRRPVSPNQEEIGLNPRARSARLRAGIRTTAPAHPLDLSALGVPKLASPA
ncbi:16S rRNA (cytosine(1402)-N(4))-methyltransferase RsmH [Methyloligella sp. GL2]|uniref:16S rRNA (cytosine(1402)-N(4))-methyltransferase RsmH n=2 Tax=unclassified Methyloligella TaxID=2625955 RepID=UPI001FED9313|nr:16S rRNA (cytosine(1402)-N(4))-methyltransferase RsmH [Methyloligella sp. GL2]